MSTPRPEAQANSTPRPEAQANSTLQVTQARVMKSEWTKLRTQPGLGHLQC